MNYYNEHDPKAAAWLRALIDAGHIAPGIVDTRSISDVQPDELTDYAQCHFFAGIGGWSLALRYAGWPDNRPVWTGSCPCQPFSAAGRRLADKDPRHLWPQFLRLIAKRSPAIVFGEQVASADGRVWLAGVRADLEDVGYAVGAADLCAAGIGAPHIRQRLYWAADSNSARGDEWTRSGEQSLCDQDQESRLMADAASERRNGSAGVQRQDGRHGSEAGCAACRVADAMPAGRPERRAVAREGQAAGLCCAGGLGHAEGQQAGLPGFSWRQSDTIACADGNTRRIESGSFPLAHGISGRMGLLRGYGNAIVPLLAAEFVSAWIDCSNAEVSDPGGPAASASSTRVAPPGFAAPIGSSIRPTTTKNQSE